MAKRGPFKNARHSNHRRAIIRRIPKVPKMFSLTSDAVSFMQAASAPRAGERTSQLATQIRAKLERQFGAQKSYLNVRSSMEAFNFYLSLPGFVELFCKATIFYSTPYQHEAKVEGRSREARWRETLEQCRLPERDIQALLARMPSELASYHGGINPSNLAETLILGNDDDIFELEADVVGKSHQQDESEGCASTVEEIDEIDQQELFFLDTEIEADLDRNVSFIERHFGETAGELPEFNQSFDNFIEIPNDAKMGGASPMMMSGNNFTFDQELMTMNEAPRYALGETNYLEKTVVMQQQPGYSLPPIDEFPTLQEKGLYCDQSCSDMLSSSSTADFSYPSSSLNDDLEFLTTPTHGF